MELIIGVIAIAVVGYFVFFRKKEEIASPAPYKVETPQQDIMTGIIVSPKEAPAPVVEEVKAEAPAPVVEAAPAKKPRKPRAPKAEKPAAKKAAPKKVAAIKVTKKSKKA
jgi:hypothetical protein